ncbi:hypothetical protein BHC48_03910 [Snodgrassella communis]|uniref:Peptidase S24/S26A/S26B/S26C domain-containing protein n=1 Tax=Snodgrassella alvi TaxID=1196083 RepID=A0A2N9XSA9_9NEIS|nr:hypothetical protein BHC48_03910 [Snodgrassella communis]
MVEVSEKWARNNIGNNLKSISIITASGDSMHPTFHNGDWLFVDQTINFYEGDGIYVFASAIGLKVKRLQRALNGDLWVVSDNKAYTIDVIPKSELDTIKICGKVVATLRLERI